MDINASAAQGRVVQLSPVEQAREVATARQQDQLSKQGLSASGQAANVHTSTTYSPSLYAQAAQYQVYTSSGTLASLLTQQGAAAPPAESTIHDSHEEIHAVEPTEGPSVDTHA